MPENITINSVFVRTSPTFAPSGPPTESVPAKPKITTTPAARASAPKLAPAVQASPKQFDTPEMRLMRSKSVIDSLPVNVDRRAAAEARILAQMRAPQSLRIRLATPAEKMTRAMVIELFGLAVPLLSAEQRKQVETAALAAYGRTRPEEDAKDVADKLRNKKAGEKAVTVAEAFATLVREAEDITNLARHVYGLAKAVVGGSVEDIAAAVELLVSNFDFIGSDADLRGNN